MRFRSILLGMIAISLVAGGPAAAFDFGFGLGGRKEAPVVMAQQSTDPRLQQLEELVRQLTGRVEELNFQILQMQDQMRRQQEDNEFRFQQLEGGAPAAAGGGERQGALTPPAASDDTALAEPSATQPQVSGALVPPADPADGGTTQPDTAGTTFGARPRELGSITFDAQGNPTGGSLAAPEALPGVEGAAPPPSSDDVVAALPPADGPEELYRSSYELILSGDYKTAEAGFRDHVERYPQDANTADARYWLGEALLGQDRYREAAEVFLEASRNYPQARKAPDMMLKLGISLAALNQRDVACATYGEIANRYPDASAALKDRVKQEQALAGC